MFGRSKFLGGQCLMYWCGLPEVCVLLSEILCFCWCIGVLPEVCELLSEVTGVTGLVCLCCLPVVWCCLKSLLLFV